MVGTSKVLTVSYGTFSCTLEGFDDPFSTMKMVAEYFRDLSAQDRFFGSEPPTPDVDMLYRIAQSGTPKRVAAEMQENGVVLRQSQEAAAAGLAATAPEPATPEQVAAPPYDEAAEVVADAPVAVATEVVAEDDASETVTPSIVSHAETADEVSAPDDAEAMAEGALDLAEDIAVDDVEEAAIAAVDTTEPVADATAEGDDYDDADAIFAAIARDDDAQPAPEKLEAETAVEDDLDDDLAAALAEIEAEAKAPPARAAAQAEPLVFHAHVPDADVARDFEDDLAAALAADDMPEAVAAPEPADTPAEHAVAPEVAARAPEAAELDDEDDSEDGDAEPLRARRGETEEERAERRRQRRERRERKRREMLGLTDEDTSDDAEGQDVDALARELATLDATSRPEVAAVAEAGQPVEASDEDTFEDDEETEVEDDAAAALAEARRARAEKALRASDLAREEQAIERLLRSTNARMDRPESTRRANALRQLKAAVAATEAERRAVPGLERMRSSRGDAFRADLDLARTDPDISSGPATPGTARPAPLVLVSEQRIDRSARPAVSRRTETDDASAEAMAASGSFAEYAGAIGAESLADLLEAAAAYTSYVEGQPRFSRAQVISKLSDVAGAPDVSREAGLRGFGQLLREGKILRVQDGQFTISKSSRYASQQRSAAG